jgi:hypothetical protein
MKFMAAIQHISRQAASTNPARSRRHVRRSLDGKPCVSPDEGIARAHDRMLKIMRSGACVMPQVKIEETSTLR